MSDNISAQATGDRPAHGLVVTAPSAFAQLVAATGTLSKTEPPDMALFDHICTEMNTQYTKLVLAGVLMIKGIGLVRSQILPYK